MRVQIRTPGRVLGHHFDIDGWMDGGVSFDDILLTVGKTPLRFFARRSKQVPLGTTAWRARPSAPVPNGVHKVVARCRVTGAKIASAEVLVGHDPQGSPLFLGRLELPVAGSVVDGDLLLVKGWALLNSRAPSKVEVLVEGLVPVVARTRIPRADVSARLAAFPDAVVSGFEARIPVPVPDGEDRVLSLRLRVSSFGDGQWVGPAKTVTLRGPLADPDDTRLGQQAWGETRDVLAQISQRTDARHLLVFTHSLTIGGGQLWLQELLNQLVGVHGWRASLVTPVDGALRRDCEALGIPVHLTSRYRVGSGSEYEGHVRELSLLAKTSGAGVALVNTLGTFPAVDAATRAGIPTGWVIHESFELPDFSFQNWGPRGLSSFVHQRWLHTLANADELFFVADATRRMFEPYSTPERCRTIRYGTPMFRFDGKTSPEDRNAARAALGYSDSDLVVLNVGIVEARKAQASLVSAIERILPLHPDLRVVIVGNHPSSVGKALGKMATRKSLKARVLLSPIVADPLPWFQAADLFVNCSDIESLPRSILEAICCGVPVLASDVFGARELVQEGVSGWLFESGCVESLTSSLLRAISTPIAIRQAMARNAFVASREWLDPDDYGRRFSSALVNLSAEALVR